MLGGEPRYELEMNANGGMDNVTVVEDGIGKLLILFRNFTFALSLRIQITRIVSENKSM